MIAINWPSLILTDSPEFPGKLTIAGMVKMCGNEDKVTNKMFDGNWGNLYAWDRPYSNIFLLSECHLFYLEVNLMPYGFLLLLFTASLLSISLLLLLVFIIIYIIICYYHLLLNMDINYSELANREHATRKIPSLASM